MKTNLKIRFIRDYCSYHRDDVIDVPINLAYVSQHEDLCESVKYNMNANLIEGLDYEMVNEEAIWNNDASHTTSTKELHTSNDKLDQIKAVVDKYLKADCDEHNICAVKALAEIHAIVEDI